jgi:hypothetical protein
MQAWKRFEGTVLPTKFGGPRIEFARVCIRPPIRERTGSVVFPPIIVKAVDQLMADNYKGVIVSAGACAVNSPSLGGPGGSPIPPTPPLLGPKPKLEDLRTPSGFAAWGSFCGAHSMMRRGGIAANIAKLPELLRGSPPLSAAR